MECILAVFQDSEIAGSAVISAERSRVDTFRASSTYTWAISEARSCCIYVVCCLESFQGQVVACRHLSHVVWFNDMPLVAKIDRHFQPLHPSPLARTGRCSCGRVPPRRTTFHNLHPDEESQAARGTFALVGQVTSTRRRSSNSNKMA